MKVANHKQKLVQRLDIFDRINLSHQQFVDAIKDARKKDAIFLNTISNCNDWSKKTFPQ